MKKPVEPTGKSKIDFPLYDRLAFESNRVLDEYEQGLLEAGAARIELENLRYGFLDMGRSFAALLDTLPAADEAGLQASAAAGSFAEAAEAAASAAGFMIDYIGSGSPADRGSFIERIRASEYYFLQGEGLLEQLKKDLR